MYLVRDLKRKEYRIIDNGGPLAELPVKEMERYEIIYEFEPKPFPDLKCSDCGIVAPNVKDRTYGSGIQCFGCYKDDKDFEEEYR